MTNPTPPGLPVQGKGCRNFSSSATRSLPVFGLSLAASIGAIALVGGVGAAIRGVGDAISPSVDAQSARFAKAAIHSEPERQLTLRNSRIAGPPVAEP